MNICWNDHSAVRLDHLLQLLQPWLLGPGTTTRRSMPDPSPLGKTQTNHQAICRNQRRIPGTNCKSWKPPQAKNNGFLTWLRPMNEQVGAMVRWTHDPQVGQSPEIRRSGEEGVENSPKVRTPKRRQIRHRH